MINTPLTPFTDIEPAPFIASLPKADIHIHQEWSPRLDRVLARREGRTPYNWQAWATALMAANPPGQARLRYISSEFPASLDAEAHSENFVARIVDLLEEAATDGAWLVEVRLGKDIIERPDCLALFAEAVQQAQARYPRLHASVIPFMDVTWDAAEVERMVDACLSWAREGLLYGVDLFNRPYDTEADWSKAYAIAGRLADAGLGMTVHVAEVSPVNLTSALKVPGITRLGHATHAGYHPELLDMVARTGVTIECSLTCNVILGAAPSYEEHPIRRFVEAGIPVALCTDDPVQMSTTIGREYAIAHALGFSPSDLIAFTRNAISAAFIAPAMRTSLLAQLDVFSLQAQI